MIYLLIFLLTVLIVYYFLGISKRDALDVYYSLAKNDEESKTKEEQEELSSDESVKIVLTLEHKIIYVFLVVFCLVVAKIFVIFTPLMFTISFIFSLAVSYIIIRIKAKIDYKNRYKLYDFYLPIVMERLVMAVQGGNDVYSAVNTISELSKKSGTTDPVTRLLDLVMKKNKSGLSFEEALALAANSVNLTSIRHAFLHLGIAQKEGGEIIGPMEELSDSTQAYYQQTVEKEIAELPIKATVPLLFAFCGLLIFFLAIPLSQLMKPSGILGK